MSDSNAPPAEMAAIREAMAQFDLSARVEPNQEIAAERTFFPAGHRGMLDLRRQLVVGNRGMGKSFWTHALVNPDVRGRLAEVYGLSVLARSDVAIGFNGSEARGTVAPTIDEIADVLRKGVDADLIWRGVLLRATWPTVHDESSVPDLAHATDRLRSAPLLYAETLTSADERLRQRDQSLLIVFDALDRLPGPWSNIRNLTKALLIRLLGLQSFHAIRAKIFMRSDQFGDDDLFRFPDSSKLKNDRVDLAWKPHELYGLLLFELLRSNAKGNLVAFSQRNRLADALPDAGKLNMNAIDDQARLIAALAGDYMGAGPKRGRVYTWLPLHLSDADENCGPRTFLTAWQSAAMHNPAPDELAVDHLGLIQGVRMASGARLNELREDYPWVDAPLSALRDQLVPITRENLFHLWEQQHVMRSIQDVADSRTGLVPDNLTSRPETLLEALARIAVMEKRANGKINVPDIFRVEAGIKRKGGVAVPRRN